MLNHIAADSAEIQYIPKTHFPLYVPHFSLHTFLTIHIHLHVQYIYSKNFSFRVFSSSNGVDQSDQNKIPNELKNIETIKKIYFYKYHLKSPKMIACSTILYRFNNLRLVGHNCLRISNTSDVPEFIKSCLIHHPPIYN